MDPFSPWFYVLQNKGFITSHLLLQYTMYNDNFTCTPCSPKCAFIFCTVYRHSVSFDENNGFSVFCFSLLLWFRYYMYKLKFKSRNCIYGSTVFSKTYIKILVFIILNPTLFTLTGVLTCEVWFFLELHLHVYKL